MKLNYRPEIDGLRAIAVFAVILYHAEIIFLGENFFEGGFIGVDIFFVISGYLITSFILREINELGSFSFINFYERRVRRILPVLLFVMMVSVFFAWKYLFPSQFINYSYSLISSLFFSSNFYFYITGQEYGAVSSLLIPFLHIWSLSVEEQFYILYPIILFICFKKLRKYLTTIIIIGLLISLTMADWGSRNYSSLNFYILPTRGWELLAGALLSKLEIDSKRYEKKIFFNFFPIIGLLLIIHSFIFFNDKMFHPSFHSLTPILGVMMIIYFSGKGDIVTKILSSKLLVGLGLISYSLYLWHYPIFAFGRVTEFLGDDLSKKFLLIFLTILLSILSYYIVEKPFRNRALIKRRHLFTYVIGSVILILLISIYTIKNNGIENRFPLHNQMYKNNEIDNEKLKKISWKFLSSKVFWSDQIKVEFKSLEDTVKFSPQFSNNKDLKKILFIGDSHSINLFNVFFQNENLFSKFEFARYGIRIKNFGNKDYDDIFLKSPNFITSDIIIVSTAWWHDDLEKIKILHNYCIKSNKILIITSKIPEFKTYTRDPLFDFYLKRLINEKKTEYSIDDLNSFFYQNLNRANFISLNKKLKEISQDLNIIYLDKYDFICNDEKKQCEGVTPEGFKVFYDYSHYTLEGAKYLGEKIYEQKWLKINK